MWPHWTQIPLATSLLPAVCAAVLFCLPLGVFQSRALCLAQTDSVYFIISSFSIFVLLLWLSRLQSEIIQLFVCVKCVYCYYFLELAHCVLFWKFNGCTMPFRFPTSCLASDSIKNRLGAYFQAQWKWWVRCSAARVRCSAALSNAAVSVVSTDLPMMYRNKPCLFLSIKPHSSTLK